jgi:predicted O-linked N-acetylglucosamine transferase (SPINDLY family)
VSEANEISSQFERAYRLHQQGKLREAFLRYDAIIKAMPRHAPALHYSGVVLHQSGKFDAAIERIRASLAIDPQEADAWSNLAIALQASGRQDLAINAFVEAARLAPNSSSVLANLAGAQLLAGRHAEAEASARQLLAQDGTFAAGWFTLALALQPQGRMLEALDAVTRAAGLAPDQEGFAGLKAQIETGIGAPDKARHTFETALARLPMSVALRFELASLLEHRIRDLPAAAAAYEQTLRIDPNHGAALSQLTFLRGKLADWRDREQLVQRYRDGVQAALPALSPFALLSLPSTRAEQRKCAETWTAALASAAPMSRRRVLSPGRLRIGYLSADFHSHATAFLTAGLFEQHDRARFEIVGYSTGPDDHSPMRARIERAFDRFIDVRDRDPFAIADIIRRDAVDILVDLKGHTQDAMPVVLARRPAPIQVHYLGYPGTLGMKLVDYLIGDAIVTPVEHLSDYAETIAVLPGAYQVNDRERPVGEPPPRRALGLPDAGIVFCSFNQTYKINPQVLDAWASILKAVPESVLWLLARTDEDLAIGNLRREAEARGVDARRVVFATHRPNAEYLALYRHADLFLDTWPYNAHTTASDALWAGCPVLTTLGTTFAGRVAASLLHAAGLPELVTADTHEYVARAIALAQDRDELTRLKTHLAGPGHASALFDTERTTRALEAAYVAMVDQFRQGVRKPFRVQAIPTQPPMPADV